MNRPHIISLLTTSSPAPNIATGEHTSATADSRQFLPMRFLPRRKDLFCLSYLLTHRAPKYFDSSASILFFLQACLFYWHNTRLPAKHPEIHSAPSLRTSSSAFRLLRSSFASLPCPTSATDFYIWFCCRCWWSALGECRRASPRSRGCTALWGQLDDAFPENKRKEADRIWKSNECNNEQNTMASAIGH